MMLNYNASSRGRVDEVEALAKQAGGKVIQEAHDAPRLANIELLTRPLADRPLGHAESLGFRQGIPACHWP